MPWLFVDYDHGTGGEAFCAMLARSPQCESLKYIKHKNGRTKVHDRFEQAWLKEFFQPVEYKESHPHLFSVVPLHSNIGLAKELLGTISSIRIQNPTDEKFKDIIKKDKLEKVWLASEPTPQYFYGLIKEQLSNCVDKEALLKLKFGTKNIDIALVRDGLEINDANRKLFLDGILSRFPENPDYPYDLIIKYEDLKTDIEFVKQQVYQKFGIEIPN